jgi:Ca2+-binding RTX toxin-like protein
MSITASFDANTFTLNIIADASDNDVTLSRTAAGALLVNGGAVAIAGGVAPTVTNALLTVIDGLDGNDNLILDETNGLLQAATFHGGAGDDVMIGGSQADVIIGDAGNDTLQGNGAGDYLYGGTGNDTLIGGRGNDTVFGEDGNDHMVWNPGDGSDLLEGGNGTDFADVNGSDDAETFTATANGARVRFDGVTPEPFALDIGTTEYLFLNMHGGDDVFSAAGNLSELISLVIDGGTGNDIISGGNGNDIISGGDGNDRIVGNQGNDIAMLGAGRDVFIWNPGDGNDTVHGGDGYDALAFNGADIAENFAISANGPFALVTRDGANIATDIDGVEAVVVHAAGGADKITVGDMSGTGVSEVSIDVGSAAGVGDGAADSVVVNAGNASNLILISGSGSNYTVNGASTFVSVLSSEAQDHLTVNGLGGDDVISAASLTATVSITLDGGDGNDTIIGSAIADTIIGGNGNDYLIGQGGDDTLIDGSGLNTLQGGTGNDRYAVQSVDDTVFEFAGEGTDEVQTFLSSYTLRPNVENLVFVNGTFSHTGVGTFENNRFTGASGNDTFTGGGGADVFDYRQASTGKDTITDFDASNASAGHDHIDLSGRGVGFANLTITTGVDGTTIGMPGGDSVVLKGVFGGIDIGDFFF